MEAFARGYLLYLVLPIWLLAGLLDWYCHRQAQIERTAGPKESLIHFLLFAEAGLPILLGLFLEINGAVLGIMLFFWLAHEVTAYWDVHYAAQHRSITPFEQRVHDYLGVVPLLAFSIALILYWPQAVAWFGLGPESLRLSLEGKQKPLPFSYVAGLLAAIFLFIVVPYLEELVRCVRVNKSKSKTRIVSTLGLDN